MKAITRKEQFLSAIAGETEAPEPRTREEVYMKRIAENGSGGGGVFTVTVEQNVYTGECLCDKTLQEITDAINRNEIVMFNCFVIFEGIKSPFGQLCGASIEDDCVKSIGFYMNQGIPTMMRLTISESDITLLANDTHFNTVYVDSAGQFFLKGTDNETYRVSVNNGTLSSTKI